MSESETTPSDLPEARPLLQSRQMIPLFELPGPDGMLHGPWDYKQREHLLLLFTRSVATTETRDLLRAFAEAYKSLREEQCAVLVVTPDPVIVNLRGQEDLSLPFALLADPTGHVIARYTQWERASRALHPSLLLVDRYGELYQQWTVAEEAALPPLAALLRSLAYLNRLCTP